MNRLLHALTGLLFCTSTASAQVLYGPSAIHGGTIDGVTITNSKITDQSLTGANASGANVTATGTTGARTAADRASDLVNVKNGRNGQPGAKGDGQIATPVVTLSGTSLTVGAALFAATDVGKAIVVANAGTQPSGGPVEAQAVATPGNGYQSVPTCAVTDASGNGTGATCSVLMSLQSVTNVGAGATCLAGAFEMTVGADSLIGSLGTPAKITGTISGGSVSGAVSVLSGGLLSALGNLTTAPAYGANCGTAPTFAMSYGVAGIQIVTQGTAYSTTQTTIALSGGSPTVAATLGAITLGAPIPPLVTTISGYTSPTQVTLTASAGTSISSTATQLLWATDDGAAFQSALSAARGIWIPAGIYWIGSTLDPGNQITVRGEGMQNTILAFDNGTSGTCCSGAQWKPLFKNSTGSPTALKGVLQFEDFQVRGLLDFGRFDLGASSMEMLNYAGLHIDRVKFFNLGLMAMQNESVTEFSVTNSVFLNILRDQARCRSCLHSDVSYNSFMHSGDDSVALHQANYINGDGVIHDTEIVVGNYFEDTVGVNILGGRNVVVTDNVFVRMKARAVNIAYDSLEGIVQVRGLLIANNQAYDTVAMNPVAPAAGVFAISLQPANALAGVTTFLPGAGSFPSSYFGKPWDYDLNSVVPGAAFAPAARGVNIHDNTVMRTLPAVANYSAWGRGKMLASFAWIDPPMSDVTMRPGAGIVTSINIASQSIHNNMLHNLRKGIVVNDAVASPFLSRLSVEFNDIFDAWEYGFVGFGTGSIARFDFIGNKVDLDPYLVSPGRLTTAGNNSWISGYTSSRCFSPGYTTAVNMALNTYADCYQIVTSPSWVMTHNIIYGKPFGSGNPTVWSSANLGIGVYPASVGEQFFIEKNFPDPTSNGPASLGTAELTHATSAAAAPTTGQHYAGDIVWSTAPATCTCSGWLAITNGTAWVAGTDYKVMAIQ